MSNKKSFRDSSSYTAANETPENQGSHFSQAASQTRRPFRANLEPSAKMDGSPETGIQKRKFAGNKPFRAESAGTAPPRYAFRSHDTNNLDDRSNSDLGFVQIRNNDEKRPFRTGNHTQQSVTDNTQHQSHGPAKDPVDEALAVIAQTASNSKVSEEASKLIKATAEQIPLDISKGTQEKYNTSDNPSAKTSSQKTKPASKAKESLSAAELKERILEKVPFIKHTDGLFAYNGRTYVAINDASQLVGIVINQVDEKMFGLSSTNVFTSVLTMLQVDKKLEPGDYTERLIASQDIVAFKNTLVNLRTMKKIPFDPWYITSFEINANYIAHPDEPEVFMNFLHTTSGGNTDIENCIIECIAYILSGSNEGKVFFVLGPNPDSGKSSLAKFLQGIFSDKYIFNVAPHEFKDRFSLGNSSGCILNISMDLASSELRTDVVSTIKRISGGDKIMTQEKNEKKTFSTSSMRLLFGTNHAISVNSTDNNDSFWNRLQVIPFTQTIPPDAKDPHLVQKLMDERDEIVSFCIQRFPDIIDRGYKMSPCQAAEEIKNEWRYGIPDDDSLESFCDTFLEITENEEDVVVATDIYKPYREYCDSLEVKPLREDKIKDWFNSHGAKCERTRLPGAKNAQSLIFGVRFIENP